jgi:cell filamentation protein, protein adenylyltransferase
MRLKYTLGNEIIHLLGAIAEKKGEVKAYFLNQPEPNSIEENRIDSVHATLYLEDRSLDRTSTADIINGLSVKASEKKIKEVKNTNRIYRRLSAFNPFSQDSFKQAYSDLVQYLSKEDHQIKASYRKDLIHFYYWSGFLGVSVPAEEMQKGMKEIFHYLRHDKDPLLIKSCIFHYAIHFYQPFEMDNEKMSRLWHTRLLMEEHPLFEFLPWEKEILHARKKYYSKLPGRDMDTDCTEFVHYMLGIINNTLNSLLLSCRKSVRPMDRIRYFYTLGRSNFSRKDYMLVHKNISMATAYRDLELAVDTGFFDRHGTNNQTTYSCALLYE